MLIKIDFQMFLDPQRPHSRLKMTSPTDQPFQKVVPQVTSHDFLDRDRIKVLATSRRARAKRKAICCCKLLSPAQTLCNRKPRVPQQEFQPILEAKIIQTTFQLLKAKKLYNRDLPCLNWPDLKHRKVRLVVV